MPILHQGYERYRGPVRRGGTCIMPIARTALLRNRRWYVWLLLVFSLLFGSAWNYLVMFLVYGVASLVAGADAGAEANGYLRAIAQQPEFYTSMMATQSFWALVMGAVVGAGEIAEDLRSGALVFYLGRPVRRFEYVAGKVLAVSIPILAVSVLPTLLLFVMQSLFEGTWEWFTDHLRFPLAAMGYGAVLCLFVSGFVLGISTIARRRRWATVSIAGVFLVLWTVAAVVAPPTEWTSHRERRRAEKALRQATTDEDRDAQMERLLDASDSLSSGSERAEWRALSPTASLEAVCRTFFGVRVPGNFAGGRHWFIVIGFSGALLAIVWFRVRAVEVVT